MWCRAFNSLSTQSDFIRGPFTSKHRKAPLNSLLLLVFVIIQVISNRLRVFPAWRDDVGQKPPVDQTAAQITQSTDCQRLSVTQALSSVSIRIIPLLSTFNGIICHLVKYLLSFGEDGKLDECHLFVKHHSWNKEVVRPSEQMRNTHNVPLCSLSCCVLFV